MLVKIYRDELSRTVLLIGEANAMRYFSMLKPSIELCLGDLHIQCTLSAEFWHGRPEIHDPRLSEWLEFKVARSRQGREPVLLTLVPSGGITYVVRPHFESHYDAFGSEVNLPRKAVTETRRPPASAPPLPTRSVA